MNESLAIDFRPGDGTVPRILTTIDDQGFTLLGIRLVPTRAGERATLRLEIGANPSAAGVRRLEHQLGALDGIIEVIHCANGGS